MTQVSCCQCRCHDPVASFQTSFTEQQSLYEFIHEVELTMGQWAHVNHVNDAL